MLSWKISFLIMILIVNEIFIIEFISLPINEKLSFTRQDKILIALK